MVEVEKTLWGGPTEKEKRALLSNLKISTPTIGLQKSF